MRAIQKKIVIDTDRNPIAVQIDYEDWLEIERLLDLQGKARKATDLSRYSGVIQLTEEPLDYQKRVRDEWP